MADTKPLNIIFAGTPEFSAVALKALLSSPHKIVAVYTQPDRPAGRGRKLTASPVKELALQHNIPVYQPHTLRDAEEQKKLADLQADVMVVVAYGLILPKPVLQAPRLGCINIHASLLPKWRGAAPIQRAIEAGDKKTGVTIMQMDEGLDTGAMLQTVACDILDTDTSAILHDRLAGLGAKAVLETLAQLAAGTALATPQDNQAATYAHKIKKEEAEIDWKLPAHEIERKIRAFNPWPVCYTQIEEQVVRVWKAEVMPFSARRSAPVARENSENVDTASQDEVVRISGMIVNMAAAGIDVITAEKDILQIQKLQLPGGKVLSVSEVMNANKSVFSLGEILGHSSC